MNGLFVTATDTGVGKTIVTAALALVLRDRGLDVGVAKPLQSGNLAADLDGDAMRLKALAVLPDDPGEMVAHAFAAPLAPVIAARIEGVRIAPDDVVAHVRALAARHQAVLVEGAGGLMAPLAEAWTCADLAAALELPLLVVARPGLGTVNHTVLTVLAARQRGLEPLGVVLNGLRPETDASAQTNAELIESFAGVPVLGVTPWLDELTRDGLRGMLQGHVDLEPLGLLETVAP
jgi:dethiobiotin synthetase